MNENQMKNIIVLKDLPSNIIDEAIVILKNNVKIKNKEKIENKNSNRDDDETNGNFDLLIGEAELIIKNYIKETEKPTDMKKQLRSMNIKYKKLQVSSFFLGIVAIIGIIISIIK